MKKIIIQQGIAVFLCISLLFIYSCSGNAPKKDPPKKYTVEIKDMKFQPAELILQKGDTVVWINEDLVAHNVTEVLNTEWHSPTLNNGQSWTFVPQKDADYYCSIHLVMTGKLLLK